MEPMRTGGRHCPSFPIHRGYAPTTRFLEAPSMDDTDELNDSLVPTWDDAEDTIHKIFDDNDDDDDDVDYDYDDKNGIVSSHHEKVESCSVEMDSSEDEAPEEKDDKNGPFSLPSWLRRHTNILPKLRKKIPTVVSSDDSDSKENNDSRSSDEADRNTSLPLKTLRNLEAAEKSHNGKYSYRQNVDSLCHFSLPKHLLPNKANSHADVKSLKKVDLSNAVRFPTVGEVFIRADLLEPHNLQEVLDKIRSFGHATRRLVLQDVHQGTVIEAVLIYLLEIKHPDGSHVLRSLHYTGSWISPTLTSFIAMAENGLEEIELGLSLYPKFRSSKRRPMRKTPRYNLSRHMKRLEELEEAIAANSSLHTLRLLPCCHVKIVEGLVWAASCHEYLQQIFVSLPIRTPCNGSDSHESDILLFEGLAEAIRKVKSLRHLALCVDPNMGLGHEHPEAALGAHEWSALGEALGDTNHLDSLVVEFDTATSDVASDVMNEMSLKLMEGISKNTSLTSLELIQLPVQCAFDTWYSVHTRKVTFQRITLRQCPDIISSLTCLEDDEERSGGWWSLASLQVDHHSLLTDLDGLQTLASAGGLQKLVVTGSLPKKYADRLLDALQPSQVQLEMQSSVQHNDDDDDDA